MDIQYFVTWLRRAEHEQNDLDCQGGAKSALPPPESSNEQPHAYVPGEAADELLLRAAIVGRGH